MQRKAYVPGTAALLAALLAGCTGGTGDGGSSDNSDPGEPGAASAQAQPGKYRTLPEPCGAVSPATLDLMLPGIAEIADEEQQNKAYRGTPILTYDTDRKVGCRWKVESATATDHLYVDFERVVSYDNTVSDDSEAERLFAGQQAAADLPEPTGSASGTGEAGASVAPSATSSARVGPTPSASGSGSGSSSPVSSPSSSDGSSPSSSPSSSEDLRPRVLDDLGDEAFLDDRLSPSGSTAKRRKVTVAFRTSNVIVTIEYEEQPATTATEPDSKEMQDKARKLAARLADALSG
ncbi:DUF3558 domain-containing protein [Streptomyces actuosus]|uniref:DUF3558 domain-containing protein n=1 Tax=Streptomyces actuosus TaxID=1885 RepID=A0ABS2VU74_STRAS|nr:DUF3558 domain-containing protein [Streptomyces actuosus]MBN0046579.1 DUF3558 domain-containing protein [Streptomyces actuosus]